jgi:hypothetical protein
MAPTTLLPPTAHAAPSLISATRRHRTKSAPTYPSPTPCMAGVRGGGEATTARAAVGQLSPFPSGGGPSGCALLESGFSALALFFFPPPPRDRHKTLRRLLPTRKMVMHTIFQKLPVSEGVKVILGCSIIFGISGYWTFKKNGKGYDNMEEKSESMRKQRGSGASPFSS